MLYLQNIYFFTCCVFTLYKRNPQEFKPLLLLLHGRLVESTHSIEWGDRVVWRDVAPRTLRKFNLCLR